MESSQESFSSGSSEGYRGLYDTSSGSDLSSGSDEISWNDTGEEQRWENEDNINTLITADCSNEMSQLSSSSDDANEAQLFEESDSDELSDDDPVGEILASRGRRVEEIKNATEQGSNKRRKENDSRSCSLCLSVLDKDLAATSCGHVFHEACIKEALSFQKQCPVCRTKQGRKPAQKLYVEFPSSADVPT